MATTTAPDVSAPIDEAGGAPIHETEPLLGRPGDASQTRRQPFIYNLTLGTGFIAQLASVLLTIVIWASVFTKPLILFSGHPLAQSLAVLVLIQSILALQPTHTRDQKRIGQKVHATLNLAAFLLLVTGVGVIEYNKYRSKGEHFHSVHGYLGVTTSIVLLIQYLVGLTMYAVPSLYGGRANAMAIWKYHRASGYVILVLLLVTVCSATRTEYVENVLKIQLWAPVLLSVLVLAGVLPRIQKHKFGGKITTS
ncbi:hypothetical protein VHEMI00196 [[Torrubiella] hemipterigena]|uniref:Cytochrome b561 domain-containing protein n=1 Tax=[Torrubiella] hemipterigena TaxID=1531966 RepID=A0A0A1SIL0_9HYPO|nr:hypothetical protein VHEMI00196 [[Torrubiella] hemipterigena]